MKEEVVKKRSLKSNYIFNFISQILTLIIPLITTPYVARVLRETGNGQYSYSLSIITYFMLFANLGFDLYGQRQVAKYQNDKESKSKIFWELFVLRIIFTVISLGVLYSVLFTIGFGENYTRLILILSIQVIAIPFDIQYLFRGDEDFKTIAIKTIVLKLIGLACIFIFVKTENDTWIYCLCLSLSTLISNLIMWPVIFKRIRAVKIKDIKILKHFWPSFLIFLPTLAVTIYSVFDKTMIGLLAQNPDYQNGCYEQAYKLNSVALLLITVVSSVMVSRNAHDYSVGDFESVKRHIYFSSSYVWMLGLPLIVGFVVLSDNLCYWFLGDGYAEVPLLLMIMSVRFIASGFGVVFGDQLFIAIGKEKYPTIATVIAAVLNVVLNYWLIPIYGAIGAAITTAVSELLVTLILGILVCKGKYVSIKHIFALSWKYIIAAAVMFVPIYFIQKYMSYSVWTFLLITFVGIIIYGGILLLLRDKFLITNLKNCFSAITCKVKTKKKIINEKTLESKEKLAQSDGSSAPTDIAQNSGTKENIE